MCGLKLGYISNVLRSKGENSEHQHKPWRPFLKNACKLLTIFAVTGCARRWHCESAPIVGSWQHSGYEKNQDASWWFQPHLKNMSQNGKLPKIWVKIKNIWNHHNQGCFGFFSGLHFFYLSQFFTWCPPFWPQKWTRDTSGIVILWTTSSKGHSLKPNLSTQKVSFPCRPPCRLIKH